MQSTLSKSKIFLSFAASLHDEKANAGENNKYGDDGHPIEFHSVGCAPDILKIRRSSKTAYQAKQGFPYYFQLPSGRLLSF